MQALWSEGQRAQYQLDSNELKSAEALLEKGKTSGGLGMHTAMPILLPAVEGCVALAWSLPDILTKWGGRIREIAMDSTCKCQK